MITAQPNPPGFWTTVWLLLRAARKRAAGRRRRQQELLHSRRKESTDWSGVLMFFAVLFMLLLNVMAAITLTQALESADRLAAENDGKIVVSQRFLNFAKNALLHNRISSYAFSSEAKRIVQRYGGDQSEIERKLQDSTRSHGTRDLIAATQSGFGVRASLLVGPLPAMLGSLVLLWWIVMLVFQGEGLELDLQRRRNPMWEWLFAHPVPTGAVFLSEMLSPIAANPVYWGAPLFVGVTYFFVYGPLYGAAAALLVGVPVSVAAACLGKALEIGVVLRFSPRTRGAITGLMSWLGYVSLMIFFVGSVAGAKIATAIGKHLGFLTILPWPWLRWFLGGQANGSFSFPAGLLTCWAVSVIVVVAAVSFTVWAAERGLSGNFGAVDASPSRAPGTGARFGKEPLYRKEFLWFLRDRSAIVQTILIPLTVAGYQMFNLRGVLGNVQGSWSSLCGAGIVFGTYFLWILGPKSLSSEGTALWIALTWPRGLENLLKAKAWLWSLISTGIVCLVLGYTAVLFPAEVWKIALVGAGWFLFSRSMAEKAVTLVTVAAESGEQQRIPWARRGAAQLGMLTFSIGVFTAQWHLAVIGIVYSWVTAAAMWENLRARLPYLYDPWSEKLPPPPTLMHAMVSISILIESVAVVTAIVVGISGKDALAFVMPFAYGICALAVSIGVAFFLSERDVPLRDIFYWNERPFFGAFPMLAGAAAGLILAMIARAYLALMWHVPAAAEVMRRSQEHLAKNPALHTSYAIVAVAFAPFAEEFLFRGLLFRALDREWGGWRAIVGSAAFFAVYHPPIAWLPVGFVGATAALLFKRTRQLAPAVVLHMVYNAIVTTT